LAATFDGHHLIKQLLNQLKPNKLFTPYWTKRNVYFFATLIPALTMTFILTDCGNCVQKAEGIILDKETKAPLDSVSVTSVDVAKNTVPYPIEYSAKSGQFKFSKISGGITQCPDLTLYFYKKGFKQNRVTFNSYSVNDTIFLEKN
jgi:hypothetical protein